MRAARNSPLLPGDKSTWAGVEDGPPPPRSLASSVSQRIRPLATLLQGSISPWQPRVVGQLSGPRRSLQDPEPRLFRRFWAAPHHHGNWGRMLWARADSRRGSQAWPGVPGKGTEGVADRRCGKGSEGREKRAESAGQSRSFFLGYEERRGQGMATRVWWSRLREGRDPGLSHQLQTNFSREDRDGRGLPGLRVGPAAGGSSG